MVPGLDSVVVCGLPVQPDYITIIVSCADIFNDFNYGIFRCDITLLSFFGSGRIQLGLCGLWASLVVLLTTLTCATIVYED